MERTSPRVRLPSPSWCWPRLQTGSGMEGGPATGRWRGGGGARTFGLVLVDLDALREELPGEHGGAGQHPGLPRHLVLLHRDLHRVHGWHERHGSSRCPPAHVPPAGLQPSQGGEPAAQSQAAGALVCPRRGPPPSSVSLPGSPAPTGVGSEFLGHSGCPALTAKPRSVPGRWGRAWPNPERIQTQVSKPVTPRVLDTRPLHCSCKATTDVSTFSSLHRGEGTVPWKCMDLQPLKITSNGQQLPLFCRQVATNTTRGRRRLLAVRPPGPLPPGRAPHPHTQDPSPTCPSWVFPFLTRTPLFSLLPLLPTLLPPPCPNLSICKLQGAAFKTPRTHPLLLLYGPCLVEVASTSTIPQPPSPHPHTIPQPNMYLLSPPQHPLPCPTISPFIPFLHLSPSHSSPPTPQYPYPPPFPLTFPPPTIPIINPPRPPPPLRNPLCPQPVLPTAASGRL